MKKNQFIIAIIWLYVFVPVLQAQPITLDECQEKARMNYPLIKRYDLIEKTKEYNLSNAGKGYLPQFSASAKASYQSQVTQIPIEIPGMKIEGPNKDQYGATIDVNQTIWDGGVISSSKETLRAAAEVEYKQLETDLYEINNRINSLYFGILLLDANLKQNKLLSEELQRNYDQVSHYIENGVANQADLDAVKVEQLNAEQTKIGLESDRNTYIEMLKILTGDAIGNQTIFLKPEPEEQTVFLSVNRPELKLFEAQMKNMDTRIKGIKTNYMPKIGVYATGGYGNPALDMLKNEFSFYWIGGVRFSWNLGGLYTQKNEKRILLTNQDNVLIQRETFLFNNTLEVKQEVNEITKYRELLYNDDEIISLRNNVKKSAEIKVSNGTMSVNDLLKEVTSEDMARQDKIRHEIELLSAIYHLKYITNN